VTVEEVLAWVDLSNGGAVIAMSQFELAILLPDLPSVGNFRLAVLPHTSPACQGLRSALVSIRAERDAGCSTKGLLFIPLRR